MKKRAAVVMLGWAMVAQAQFEAASVHASEMASDEVSRVQVGPNSVSMRGVTFLVVMQWAFDVERSQVVGPDWMQSSGFDIVAKASAPVANERELRAMLRVLLAERFGLKVHTETKETQVYALKLAKGGPKFKQSTSEGPPVFGKGRGSLVAERITMKDFAIKLSEAQMGRPVVDETGLEGKWDIQIDIAPYMQQADGERSGAMDIPSILFTALPQQLGVKLEGRKDSVQMVVVDRVQKEPTAN